MIDKDSYIQLDNTIKIEYQNDLIRYRRQDDRLSEEKLKDVINAYCDYHEKHHIDENKQVYIDREELVDLQHRS